MSLSNDSISNTVTRQAMLIAEAKELGLIPDDSQTFTSIDAAWAYLNDENDDHSKHPLH